VNRFPVDPNGQPAIRAFRARQVAGRTLDELIGLCKGCAADGVVNQHEAEYLLNWLQVNEPVSLEWPASVLRIRILEYLEDGVLDQDEKDELLDLLRKVTGENGRMAPANFSTGLCFDCPLPELIIDDQAFCFTGQFAYGSRQDCVTAVTSLGGRVVSTPLIKEETVLVVGLLASRDWKHGTHGTKIIKAVQMRDAGKPISIVPEDHWMNQLVKVMGL
jgi:hypothetical protein